eukprot:gi/632974678/ref/XP_007903811.1/ PREDICTED: protein NPAT isoform X2 [Callorhinchus milii]
MLLPSDIARLVLGYLQQEKLSNTYRAFILESADLKEYAEHSTEDGVVPACLLSLFGKNLKTILNEYVVMKAKDSMPEAPAVLPSLWRKLEYTLSQIRNLQQSSLTIASNQRARTKNSLTELRRRGACSSRTISTANSSLLSISPQIEPMIITPLAANPVMIMPSSGVNPVISQPQPDLCSRQSHSQDLIQPTTNLSADVLHIIVPGSNDRRIHAEHISPAKRKCDSPRKRSGLVSGQNSAAKAAENEGEESQVEIAVENFPQRVIENAREKILKDRSLLEKLAENINKVMFSESNTHTSKPPDSSTSLPDQSIDEILGLGDEVHMSDEAIQDILEQTESDPAFQALYDLFDYGKSKKDEDIDYGLSGQDDSQMIESSTTSAFTEDMETRNSLQTEELGKSKKDEDTDHGLSRQDDLQVIESSTTSAFTEDVETFNSFQTEELDEKLEDFPSTVLDENVQNGSKSKADSTVTVTQKTLQESSSSSESKKQENLFQEISPVDAALSTDNLTFPIQANECNHCTAEVANSAPSLSSTVADHPTESAVCEPHDPEDVAEMEVEDQSPSTNHESADESVILQQDMSEEPAGIQQLTDPNEKAQDNSQITQQSECLVTFNEQHSVCDDAASEITSPGKLKEPVPPNVLDKRIDGESAVEVCEMTPSTSSESLFQSSLQGQNSCEMVLGDHDGSKLLLVEPNSSSIETVSEQPTVSHSPVIDPSSSLINAQPSQDEDSSLVSTVNSSSVNSINSSTPVKDDISEGVELPDQMEPVSSSVSSRSNTEAKATSLHLDSEVSGLKPVPEGNNLSSNTISTFSPATTSATSDVIPTSEALNPEPSSTVEVDPKDIVNLKIVICDDPKQPSSDTELTSAVSSITNENNENMPTIVLSSPGGTSLQGKGVTQPSTSGKGGAVTVSSHSRRVSNKEIENAVNILGVAEEPESTVQNLALVSVQSAPTQSITTCTLTVSSPQRDRVVFSTQKPIGLSNNTGYIQLLPAGATFGQSNSVLIATCVPDSPSFCSSPGRSLNQRVEPNNRNPFVLGGRGSSANVLMLPNSCGAATFSTSVPQALSTPPRPSTILTMGQPVSSSFPQGSTFYITSPIQPVLQGMVGVIPVSVMGQNSPTPFTVSTQQVFQPPASSPLRKQCPRFSKLPISRKQPQITVSPGTAKAGQSSVGTFISLDSSVVKSSCQPQRSRNEDQRITLDQIGKPGNPLLKCDTPSLKSPANERHRRVLCFDNTVSTDTNPSTVESSTGQDDKQTNNVNHKDQTDSVCLSGAQSTSEQNKERSERTDTSLSKGREIQGKLEKNKSTSSSLSQGTFHKATANKENEKSRVQVRQRCREVSDLSSVQQQKNGSQDERPSSQASGLDKEGTSRKISDSQQEGKKGSTALKASQDRSSKRNQDKSANESFSLTGTLTKQAAEMLQDIQRQSPVPKQGINSELPVPRTPGSNVHEGQYDCSDFQRTPQSKCVRDDRASPRVMAPPTTPDLPSCSPASEAGSENSVNMAAHTLMILSRAASARTGATPLKDSTCQIRSSLSQAKKRKLDELEEDCRQQSLSNKTDVQNSSSPGRKRKSKSHKYKKKKHLDSFPVEMDVEKFLNSLKYDE